MQPPNHHSRINLAELKAQIVKKLGPEGSNQYFYYLNRFLSLKLTKVEFNKLCLRIVGRENIPLHNQLICSILKNVCCAKTLPPTSLKDDILNHGAHVSGKDVPADGYLLNGAHTGPTQTSGLPALSNGGDMIPISPRKARTGFRDRRTGDRRSALGPSGKTSFAPQPSAATQSSNFNVVLENGDSNPPDVGRSVQQSENEHEILVPHDAKMSALRSLPDGSDPSCSNYQTGLVVRDDGKETSARIPLRAPLGLPLCPVSIGGARRALPQASSSRRISTLHDGVLLDSPMLRERMEQIAVVNGLEGVSMDSANLLNHGLDLYMKGLIRSCIELVGLRSGHELTSNNPNKHHSYVNLINGIRPRHQYQMQQDSGKPLEVQGQRIHDTVSLHDFRVAMELNPRKLGEDWPLLLEKICTLAFEE